MAKWGLHRAKTFSACEEAGGLDLGGDRAGTADARDIPDHMA